MQVFNTTGNHHNDRWLVNGSPVFAMFPKGVLDGIDANVPIYLKVGNPSFGEMHIREKHFHWVRQQKIESVAALVYYKLGQPGEVYCSEAEKKLKIMMRLKPSALLIMELIEHPEMHFSVTTIYYHQGNLDGEKIGRYPGRR